MATLVATTVDTGGTGNYSSLNAAEAANWGAGGADITAAGTDEYVECTCICTDGNADTTAVTIDGMITDATHDIDVSVGATYLPLGVYPTSGNQYRLDCSLGAFGKALRILDHNVTIRGFAVRATANGDGVGCVQTGWADVNIERSIFVMVPGAHTLSRVLDLYGDGTVKCSNIIAYGSNDASGIGVLSNKSGGAAYLHNITVVGCSDGFSSFESAEPVVRNSIAFNNTSNDYTGTFAAGTTNNGYTTGQSGPTGGSNAIDLGSAETVVFNAPGSDIYHMVADSPARGVGTDLSGDADLPITVDILGGPRPTTPSIGAHEYQVLIPTTAREPLSKPISKWSLDAVRNQPTYHP